MTAPTIRDTHFTDRPRDEHGNYYPVDIDDLIATWERRTGPDNIRRHWQIEDIDNVLDVAWLRENISRFDDDALISLFVDLTSFSGGVDFSEQLDIILAARPDEWWVRE